MTTAILHTVLAALIIGAYTALSITGHDGTALLGVLAGQGAGAVVAGTGQSIVKTVPAEPVAVAVPTTPPAV